jgi:hypothetical protein
VAAPSLNRPSRSEQWVRAGNRSPINGPGGKPLSDQWVSAGRGPRLARAANRVLAIADRLQIRTGFSQVRTAAGTRDSKKCGIRGSPVQDRSGPVRLVGTIRLRARPTTSCPPDCPPTAIAWVQDRNSLKLGPGAPCYPQVLGRGFSSSETKETPVRDAAPVCRKTL